MASYPYRVLCVTDWRSMCCPWRLMLTELVPIYLNNVSMDSTAMNDFIILSYSLWIYFATAEYGPKIESCLKNLLDALDEVVDTFKKALYFLLIRVSHTHQGRIQRGGSGGLSTPLAYLTSLKYYLSPISFTILFPLF